MSNFEKQFKVEPGARIKLKDVDADFHGKQGSHEQAQPETQLNLEKMNQLQSLLYAEHKRSLLIVLQGLDAAGKDGVIRHVFSGVNPEGCSVASFKQPTHLELSHDFLWRIHAQAPAKGMVTVFNRSHYEDVLIARVHELVPEKVWSKRYEQINEFEKLLALDNDTLVLKFFLYISKDEQLARFKQRLDDPNRQWKISEADYQERGYWDEYLDAYEEVLHQTSTDCAPWYVIPSNHKWFRNLAISEIIVSQMEALKMKAPKPTVDLAEIRRKYHREAGK